MTHKDVYDLLKECINTIAFKYNGKLSGVTVTVSDSIPKYQSWHGDEIRYYSTVEETMSDPFFSGKTLKEIAEEGYKIECV